MMGNCELDAIRAYIRASEDLLPYCNDDAADSLTDFLEDVRAHVAEHISELEAERDALLSEHRRAEHRRQCEARGLRVVKGGKA